MNLLADESVDGPIVHRLREEGHEVAYVAELAPGLNDEAAFDEANRRRAILLTADKDFGELVFRIRKVAHGVILVRLAGLAAEAKAQTVVEALRIHGQDMVGAFTVISPGLLRVRKAAPI